MKFFNKKSVKNILLLLLVSFLIIPVILQMLKMKEVVEGMTSNEPENETENETENIGKPGDDIETVQNETEPGVIPSNIGHVNRVISEEEGKHHYCLGGELYCKYNNAELEFVEDYNFGKTYKAKCSDGEPVICNNKMRSTDIDSINLFQYDKENKEKVEGSDIQYPESDKMIGFTKPLSYTPVDLSNQDFMIYYKPNGDALKTNRCLLFGPEKCIQGNLEDDSNDKECPNAPELKCLANHGTKIGDPLCCGQTGVLQNTDYVCPEELPHCTGYKCGSQWGTCMKNEPSVTPTEVETNPEAAPQ